jgi:hypothetical protein
MLKLLTLENRDRLIALPVLNVFVSLYKGWNFTGNLTRREVQLSTYQSMTRNVEELKVGSYSEEAKSVKPGETLWIKVSESGVLRLSTVKPPEKSFILN